MSNSRYLEVVSTYRDRSKWPNQAEFEIPMSQSGTKDRYGALDPVSLAAPITYWTANAFNALGGVTVTAAIANPATIQLSYSTTMSHVIITTSVVASQRLQQINDYYISAVANNTTISSLRRILSYKYLGTNQSGTLDVAVIELATPFPDSSTYGDEITISDPTDTSNPSYPVFFVPNGRIGRNAYPKYLLYNETLNEYRNIIFYDEVSHLVQVDTSGSTTTRSGPTVGWTNLDSYSIRIEPPMYYGSVSGVPTVNAIPILVAPSVDPNYYYRQFIRMTSGPATGQVSMIVRYDTATQTIGIFPAFASSPVAGNTFELLSFSYDNAMPYIYTGSTLSQQEDACYELKLINLILPNKILNTSHGSRTAFYPYVYVEFTTVGGSGSGAKNIIYSNNPNATRMLFRATIDDVQNPLVSSFIKVDGDCMTQTVKFKPNENIKFSVHMPNGELYETYNRDTVSPFIPNDEIQLSALFSMKRL